MNDPRAARTRARLRAALFEACEDRPLGEVSVARVTRLARVSRGTFYLHYEDLPALAVDACAELLREAVDALHASTDPPSVLTELLGSVSARENVYRSLIGPGGGGPLGEALHGQLRERALAERRRRAETPGDEAIASAVAATFTGVLGGRLHGHVPGTDAEVATRIWTMVLALHRSG
ncbi:TetR/AcrR family transcriptional regulator [Amycolatopsis sp. YIM 10]|uniref:TetR/AcrR family transcriptional regulator n=1 Tax=Amycolatopsis sp. YIM 10 TaxID=2653857 RepID=UPI0012907213|nr:TetR/AcrR family transcriptional regulator [Amycolatopsis sp. YIM 10]